MTIDNIALVAVDQHVLNQTVKLCCWMFPEKAEMKIRGGMSVTLQSDPYPFSQSNIMYLRRISLQPKLLGSYNNVQQQCSYNNVNENDGEWHSWWVEICLVQYMINYTQIQIHKKTNTNTQAGSIKRMGDGTVSDWRFGWCSIWLITPTPQNPTPSV